MTMFSFRTSPVAEAVFQETPASTMKDKLRRIRGANNKFDVWLGGSENDDVRYPKRLVSADKISPRVRAVTEDLIVDSNVGDSDMTNEEVLQAAIDVNAQYVVAKDYLAENMGGRDARERAIDATYESAVEFHELWLDHGCPGNVIYPLQPDHAHHYEKYESFYEDVSFLGVGGLRGAAPDTQVAAVQSLREVVGPHQWLHGFGFGCAEHHLEAAWSDRPYVDSVDVSTFEQLPKNNVVLDADLTQHTLTESKGDGGFVPPRGELVSGLNARETEKLIHLYIFELTELSDRAPRGDGAAAGLASDTGVRDTGDSQLTLDGDWGDATT